MAQVDVIEIGRDALALTVIVAGPMLMAGLIVGLAVGVFQATTQIHEMTLTFIPKILIVGFVLALLMPWMLANITDYIYDLFGKIVTVNQGNGL